MGSYTEIKGDLIKLGLEKKFDMIAHGCNCHCIMGAGIAPLFAKHFGADKFPLESSEYRGAINKLGMIDVKNVDGVYVVNCYTQYDTGGRQALDYEALVLCFRKLNKRYKGKSIGLPQIGCGLGGGSWPMVCKMIQSELKDMDVTVVIFSPLRDETSLM